MAYITKKSDLGGSKAKEEYIAKSNIFEKPEYIKKKEIILIIIFLIILSNLYIILLYDVKLYTKFMLITFSL